MYIKFKIELEVFKKLRPDLKNKGYDFFISLSPTEYSYAAFENSNWIDFENVFSLFINEEDFLMNVSFFENDNLLIYRPTEYTRIFDEIKFPV